MATIDKVIQDFLDREAAVADFIQNGPSEGIQGWARDKYRHRCNELANVPAWARALGGLAFGSASRICQPYWQDQGVDGPVLAPPFTGGQCEERYRFEVTGTLPTGVTSGGVCVGTQNFTVTSSVWGPILGFSNGPGNCTGGPGGGTFTLRCTCFGAGGAQRSPTAVTINVAQPAYTATVQNIRLVSGDPDDCGDPPSIPQPGPNPPTDPGPLPGPEPTDDPEGGPFPVIPIPPYEDPVGGPTPIEPPPDTTGSGGGNPAGGDGLPGEDDSVGGGAGGATGGEDGEDVEFGAPPIGKVWVGALIECTVDSRLGNIPGTGPQNTVYPTAIANASLRYSIGYGKSQIIRSKWTDLVRPVTSLIVEGCFVQAQPGVSASVRPISASICPENPCED